MIRAMKFEIEISVKWGDMDQAAIVFYPIYFKWFDIGTRHLLDAAGLSYATLQSEAQTTVNPCLGAWRRTGRPAASQSAAWV